MTMSLPLLTTYTQTLMSPDCMQLINHSPVSVMFVNKVIKDDDEVIKTPFYICFA